MRFDLTTTPYVYLDRQSVMVLKTSTNKAVHGGASRCQKAPSPVTWWFLRTASLMVT